MPLSNIRKCIQVCVYNTVEDVSYAMPFLMPVHECDHRYIFCSAAACGILDDQTRLMTRRYSNYWSVLAKPLDIY